MLNPISFEGLSAAMQKYHSMKLQFSQTDLDALWQVIGRPQQEYKNRFLIIVSTRLRTIDYSLDKLNSC